jgi:hypothetical protein
MSNSLRFTDIGGFATSKCVSEPILQGFGKSDCNLPQRIAQSTNLVTSDWRAEAEARGRAAFDTAAAVPSTTVDPLAWLWGGSGVQGANKQ